MLTHRIMSDLLSNIFYIYVVTFMSSEYYVDTNEVILGFLFVRVILFEISHINSIMVA